MFRRLFNRFRPTPLCGDPEMARLAASLTGVGGSSFVWCNCGQLLTPIVVGYDDGQAEVVVLACVPCRGVVPVCVGVLVTHAPAGELHV